MRATSVRKEIQEIVPGEGRSLRQLLAGGERPDRATLVDWGCQLLEILAAAHARGVLHRHITEDEVIVTPEGQLVLNGFGLKRLILVPGSNPPPEQLAGAPYTARGDLYAVGSLLSRLAFAGALRGARGSLGARDPLLKVLARATCTDPAARYESAQEMAEALREAGRPDAVARPQRRQPEAASGGRVAIFPGGAQRQPPASSPSSGLDDGGAAELWRSALLLVISVLLVTIVVTTGWFLFGRDGAYWPADDPAMRPSAPLASSGSPAQKRKPGAMAPGFAAPQCCKRTQGIKRTLAPPHVRNYNQQDDK
jgi:serine/threonine protein kinase